MRSLNIMEWARYSVASLNSLNSRFLCDEHTEASLSTLLGVGNFGISLAWKTTLAFSCSS